jgi:DsbE subfamily thiol:disulfide oxidoreductase
MMVLGGVVSLTDRHHRIGAPLRRIVSKIATPPAAGQPAAGSAAAAGSAPRKASRSWLYLAPFLVFAILGAFFIHRLQLAARGDTPNLIPSVMIDKPAPPFDLPPLMEGGQGFKRADLQGQVTLVSFFASWCAPCRIEHPLVQELAQTPGLAVVGVNYKDKPEDAKAWLAQLGDPYKTVAVDAHGRAGIDFGLYGVPEAYLIDKQGVIRFKQIGPLSQDVIDKQLVPMVEKLNK